LEKHNRASALVNTGMAANHDLWQRAAQRARWPTWKFTPPPGRTLTR